MVCEKCEKKLGTVITPDTWKDGARNTTGICAMCGKKVLDTKNYKQTSV
ncbi:Cysteine-rich PDZ-binding protein [Myotis brandtii]|uniref:Cysteine-rich PDZ-binding protein n=1 Tax=Myotis brandtii TaxID=109478 RepID=S7PFX7_MYOBR|nr:Cysteine-rich PDZ-binding protein [Myotis brandtii]